MNALMRRLHRWTSPIIFIFMMAIAISGVYLLVDIWRFQVSASGPNALPGATAGPPGAANGGGAFAPGGSPPAFAPGGAPPAFAPGGAPPAGAPYPAAGQSSAQGAAPSPPPQFTGPSPLTRLMMRLHTGDGWGLAGKVYALLSGVVLIFLCLSGLWMYVSMFLARLRAGKKSMFWG